MIVTPAFVLLPPHFAAMTIRSNVPHNFKILILISSPSSPLFSLAPGKALCLPRGVHFQAAILECAADGKSERMLRLEQSRRNPLNLLGQDRIQLRQNLRLVYARRQLVFRNRIKEERALSARRLRLPCSTGRRNCLLEPQVVVSIINPEWRLDDRYLNHQLDSRRRMRREIRARDDV